VQQVLPELVDVHRLPECGEAQAKPERTVSKDHVEVPCCLCVHAFSQLTPPTHTPVTAG
jgi:hypothetical protein